MSYVTVENEQVFIDKKLDIILYNSDLLADVIRKKERQFIMDFISNKENSLILDYGCGSSWLSYLLQKKGFNIIGVDNDSHLLRSIKKIVPSLDFVLCDCCNLPFRDKVFGGVIGIAILHHLNLLDSISEVSKISNNFLFLEPNKLNFLSYIGRKLFPTETHVMTEQPLAPSYLNFSLKQFGVNVEKQTCIFCFVFPLARLFKLLNVSLPLFFVKLVFMLETFMEKTPFVKLFNSTIVTQCSLVGFIV